MRRIAWITIVALVGSTVAQAVLAGGPDSVHVKTALLETGVVAEELGLSDEQKQQVAELKKNLRDRHDQRGDWRRYRSMSGDDRRAFLSEARQKKKERLNQASAKLAAILNESQQQRLREVYLQTIGIRALREPDVLAELQLSDETAHALRAAGKEGEEEFRQQIGKLLRSGDRSTLREKTKELHSEAEQRVLAVLTQSQRDHFQTIKGEPLAISHDDLRRVMHPRDLDRRGRKGPPRGPRGK